MSLACNYSIATSTAQATFVNELEIRAVRLAVELLRAVDSSCKPGREKVLEVLRAARRGMKTSKVAAILRMLYSSEDGNSAGTAREQVQATREPVTERAGNSVSSTAGTVAEQVRSELAPDVAATTPAPVRPHTHSNIAPAHVHGSRSRSEIGTSYPVEPQCGSQVLVRPDSQRDPQTRSETRARAGEEKCSPGIDFARWFMQARREASIPFVDPHGESVQDAEALLELYGRAACEARAKQLFDACKSGKVQRPATITALKACWKWNLTVTPHAEETTTKKSLEIDEQFIAMLEETFGPKPEFRDKSCPGLILCKLDYERYGTPPFMFFGYAGEKYFARKAATVTA